MKNMERIAMFLMAAVMLMAAGAAQAETLSLNGTVEAGVTIPVYAPIGGTVDTVSVEAGMHVAAGDTLFSYLTEKTYASEDGAVTGVFVKAGDDAETITLKNTIISGSVKRIDVLVIVSRPRKQIRSIGAII